MVHTFERLVLHPSPGKRGVTSRTLLGLLDRVTPYLTAIRRLNKTEMYVKSNIEESKCNHCFSGKAMRITQLECVHL